eukprot:scaffold123770_cov71-Cyclotella_meneghiniana.AAC.8
MVAGDWLTASIQKCSSCSIAESFGLLHPEGGKLQGRSLKLAVKESLTLLLIFLSLAVQGLA